MTRKLTDEQVRQARIKEVEAERRVANAKAKRELIELGKVFTERKAPTPPARVAQESQHEIHPPQPQIPPHQVHLQPQVYVPPQIIQQHPQPQSESCGVATQIGQVKAELSDVKAAVQGLVGQNLGRMMNAVETLQGQVLGQQTLPAQQIPTPAGSQIIENPLLSRL